jgi:hypothetical protein
VNFVTSQLNYPVVLLPKLIQSHRPKQVVVQKLAPIERLTPARSLRLRGYSLHLKYLAFISLGTFAAILLRFINVHTHNGFTIASAITMALAIISIGKELDEEAAIATRQRKAAPQFQTIEVQEWQVANWPTVLAGKVRPHAGISIAQAGDSEADFAKYLQKYFGTILKPSYTFSIPKSEKVYSADFCLVLPSGLSFCLEIDEPYEWKTGKPHHCIDQGKDEQRDKFFLEGNWMVVRFSEKQIVTQPESCCLLIAKTVDRLTGNSQFANQFDAETKIPQLDPKWTISEAKAMANTKYRSSYSTQNSSIPPNKTAQSARGMSVSM